MAPPSRPGTALAPEGSVSARIMPNTDRPSLLCRARAKAWDACSPQRRAPEERQAKTIRRGSDLDPQGLRLPQHARERLARLADHLCATGTRVSAAEATRGLCLLAIELVRGGAGAAAAEAFRAAAGAPGNVRDALDAFVLFVDADVPTIRASADHECLLAEERSDDDLVNQALRLPRRARDELDVLARELSAAGTRVTATKATRGLCLLAVELVDGAAGSEVAEAFGIAAGDPTPEGVHRAVEALGALLDGAPSTMPDPPIGDDTAPTTQRGDTLPPPSFPRAA